MDCDEKWTARPFFNTIKHGKILNQSVFFSYSDPCFVDRGSWSSWRRWRCCGDVDGCDIDCGCHGWWCDSYGTLVPFAEWWGYPFRLALICDGI